MRHEEYKSESGFGVSDKEREGVFLSVDFAGCVVGIAMGSVVFCEVVKDHNCAPGSALYNFTGSTAFSLYLLGC